MIALLVRVFGERRRRHVASLLVAAVACMLAGAGLFALSQNVAFTTALYWAITTATTVGYGDVTPHNAAGRVVASAVMLTTIPLLAGVFALVTGGAVVAGIRRILDVEERFPAGTYRLIVGMSPTVPAILEELEAAGVPVVLAADVDPGRVHRGVHVVRGDPTEPATVRSAKPEGAQQALVTGASDGDVLVSAVILRKQAPDLPITALVSSASVREALQEIGVQHAVSADELLARTVATTLETPHAGEMVAQLVESGRDILAEVDAEPAAIGKPLSVVRGERAGLVLGLVHAGRFTLGIADDPVVAAGDRLLIAEAALRERRRTGRLPARVMRALRLAATLHPNPVPSARIGLAGGDLRGPRPGPLVVRPGRRLCWASGVRACSRRVAGHRRGWWACQSTSLIITKKASANGSR